MSAGSWHATRMTPNTYEAPACQGTNEVRAEDGSLPRLMHSRSSALGVTDLISRSGWQERVLHQTPIEGHAPRSEASGVAAGDELLHPRNDCVPSYRLSQCDGFAASVGRAS